MMTSERMTGAEAARLLAAMTPGTLSVERVAGARRLAVPQGDELALVIRDAPRKFEGAVYSLEVCRGMDGPTRDANAAGLAAVKRALAAVVEAEERVAAERARCAAVCREVAADYSARDYDALDDGAHAHRAEGARACAEAIECGAVAR